MEAVTGRGRTGEGFEDHYSELNEKMNVNRTNSLLPRSPPPPPLSPCTHLDRHKQVLRPTTPTYLPAQFRRRDERVHSKVSPINIIIIAAMVLDFVIVIVLRPSRMRRQDDDVVSWTSR
jgi:hypothetical protein